MKIKKIRLQNFKNFKDEVMEFGDMNILVGANASGKSNFLQALQFLKDKTLLGIEDAISLQGGEEYIFNLYDKNIEKKLKIEVEYENEGVTKQYLLQIQFKEKGAFSVEENETIDFFRHCSLYDFRIDALKMPSSLLQKSQLETNGSNLASVLRHLFEQEEKKNELIGLMAFLLPQINNISVVRGMDSSLMLTMNEAYQTEKAIPSELLSEGTILSTALVTALYFQNGAFNTFEEPEKGIHPALLAGLMTMFYEVSQKKQILITTHNPELLKHCRLADIRLIQRNANGLSNILKPIDKEMVNTFLKNEIGIDVLFTQNLLDV